MKIYQCKYNREKVKNDNKNMYIFIDNKDRDGGHLLISNMSWYAKKYGINKHYPTRTSAVIRGLDNAYPITLKHFNDVLWTNEDIEEFKKTIDSDFDTIYNNIDRYENIIIPFNADTNISKENTSILYEYFIKKWNELYNKISNI